MPKRFVGMQKEATVSGQVMGDEICDFCGYDLCVVWDEVALRSWGSRPVGP
jgi:hypothetical protein